MRRSALAVFAAFLVLLQGTLAGHAFGSMAVAADAAPAVMSDMPCHQAADAQPATPDCCADQDLCQATCAVAHVLAAPLPAAPDAVATRSETCFASPVADCRASAPAHPYRPPIAFPA
jgi:hypothetical protein